MLNNTQNILSKKCESIYTVLKVCYFLSFFILLGFCVFSFWISTLPQENFFTETIKINDTTLGFISVNQKFTVSFSNIVELPFLSNPKMMYIAHLIFSIISILLGTYVLKYLTKILKNIVRTGIPYTTDITSSIFKIGILIMFYGFFQKTIVPLILSLLGINQWNIQIIDPFTLLIGGVVICLSYVFSYGLQLQKEADETL